MIAKLSLFFSIFFLILNAGAESNPHGLFVKPKSCLIIIKSHLKTGEVREKKEEFDFKSKSQCENMKSTFSNNFSPKHVSKVEVKMTWRGR